MSFPQNTPPPIVYSNYDSLRAVFQDQRPTYWIPIPPPGYIQFPVYDIFLSHSSNSREFHDVVYSIHQHFISQGFSVFTDWYSDPMLDSFGDETIIEAYLNFRMRCCKCLILIGGGRANESKWVKFEVDNFHAEQNIFFVTTSDSNGTPYILDKDFKFKESKEIKFNKTTRVFDLDQVSRSIRE